MRDKELLKRSKYLPRWKIRGTSYAPGERLVVIWLGYGKLRRTLAVKDVSEELARLLSQGRATIEVRE